MSWETVELSDVCSINMGQAPKGDSYNTDGIGTPLIAGAGSFGVLYPQSDRFTNKPTKISSIGDIILCVRATIGDINWSDKSYCLGRGVAGLTANGEKLNQNYLWHLIPFVTPELLRKARGATFLQVTKSDISDLKIPLPPLAEQKRIASILDAADELRKQRKQNIAKLDELLQATFLDMFGDPVTNPKGWEVKKLEVVANKITDGTHHSPPIVENGIPYITAKHLKKEGLKFFDNPWFVSEKSHKEIFARCNPEKGDVLYIKDGATTGIAAINKYDFEFSMLSSLALIKVDKKVLNSYFLVNLLNNERNKIKLTANMGGAAIKRFTIAKIKKFDIPIPPLTLQTQFACIVEKVEAQKAVQQAHLAELDTLFASLQQRAFAGEL